jgi:hypothetical protein
MTYLDVVNNVLRRLREEEVNSVQDTTYSKMVGDFVNDAKRIVENAWDWSATRLTMTITTVPDVFNYVLAGSQNRLKVLDVINDTQNAFMEYRPQVWFDEKYLIQPVLEGTPQYYTFNGVDPNGDTQIDIYPKPDSAYVVRFNAVVRDDDLTADADDVIVPAAPIIHLAVALLARERGETGGTSAQEYFSIADSFLSDAIALDAAKHPEEVIWSTP